MLGLAVHDDGNGPALYAAEYDAIWRWDGAAWMSLEQSPWGVYDLLSFDDGSGPALWAGGAFVEVGGRVATGITKWACAANWLPGDLNCDGLIDGRDVNPFVLRLSDRDAWEAAYPGCPPLNGDLDGGGTVGFDDINPFVAVLAGGGR